MRLVLLRERVLYLNRPPSTGMSPSPGIFSTPSLNVSCIRPPMTTIWPSSTSTVDSTERLLVIMPEALVLSCTLDTS